MRKSPTNFYLAGHHITNKIKNKNSHHLWAGLLLLLRKQTLKLL